MTLPVGYHIFHWPRRRQPYTVALRRPPRADDRHHGFARTWEVVRFTFSENQARKWTVRDWNEREATRP